MKTCFKCGIEKPLFDFYKHKKMADGHLNKCKECAKSDVHQHRHGKGRKKVLAYDKARSSRPDRVELRKRVNADWVAKYPMRRAAHMALQSAIRSGLVQKWPACAVPDCCSTRPVAHHPDYDRPLDVVWLCQAHHKQAHALVTTG